MSDDASKSKVELSEAQWREKLGADRYRVLRQAGTERAFTGAYWDTKTPGVYRCGGCGIELFSSQSKFDSGCGWPSFTIPIAEGRVLERADDSLGMRRIETVCANCEGHLGHVFPDGPKPTGLRYCINSLSLELEPTED